MALVVVIHLNDTVHKMIMVPNEKDTAM